MSPDRPTRRRAIAILAASAGALVAARVRAAPLEIDYEWRGLSMGADARIQLCGIEARQARRLAAMAVNEIERLEQALSLYRSDSEICRLNRETMLRSPSGDMRRALALALAVGNATDGLFDPTVQALWEAHVDWFATAPDGLPPEPLIATARRSVGWKRVVLAADGIELGQGQRITLNGLAQGYVTDRVADLLRGQGLEHVLVDLGEQRTLGARPDGEPWLVACEGRAPLKLRHGALATSEGAGCVIGAAGAAHHLFDPRTGRSALHWRRMIVHHASAAVADALSTALYAASPDEIAALLPRMGNAGVLALDRNGRERNWNFAL